MSSEVIGKQSCRTRAQSRTQLRKSWDRVTNVICVVCRHQWVSSKAPECTSKMCGLWLWQWFTSEVGRSPTSLLGSEGRRWSRSSFEVIFLIEEQQVAIYEMMGLASVLEAIFSTSLYRCRAFQKQRTNTGMPSKEENKRNHGNSFLFETQASQLYDLLTHQVRSNLRSSSL